MGDIIVRLTVNKKNGTYNTKVISHQNGAMCGDGVDEDIVRDLLNAEIPGFGELTIHNDSGHTCEYFESRKAKQTPRRYRNDENDDDEEDNSRSKSKKIDVGYGV